MTVNNNISVNRKATFEYDLIEKKESKFSQIKIDVGLEDEYLEDLYINDFEKVCQKFNQKLIIGKHKGFDHGYYFIQSFIEDHIKYHISI